MKISEATKVKNLVEKLEKEGKLNVPTLKEKVDFSKINQETKNFISSKLEEKKKEVSTKSTFGETFPIYKEVRELMQKNNLTKVIRGTEEDKFCKKVRRTFRNKLNVRKEIFQTSINFSLDGITEKEVQNFQSFLDEHLLKANVYQIDTFIGSTSDQERLKDWKEIISNFPKK